VQVRAPTSNPIVVWVLCRRRATDERLFMVEIVEACQIGNEKRFVPQLKQEREYVIAASIFLDRKLKLVSDVRRN
ncbi:MAG: hypothetical protein KDB22_24950, partial [Planctomycetales bacterium]|nr:hypothetical protein [Planctomycetales bacterium]